MLTKDSDLNKNYRYGRHVKELADLELILEIIFKLNAFS